MAGGLAALLDDVAAIAKMASAASTKAVGLVVDDTAVTPRYVEGLQPARELPIIWRIAKGSIVNKMIILVGAMALSQWAEWLLAPILMLGGAYLCYEGVEKIWEIISGHGGEDEKPVLAEGAGGKEAEDKLVRGAVTTDFILSAEIMVLSLKEVAESSFVDRLFALLIVAFVITALVYGVVALIVKMDDAGLKMIESGRSENMGRMLLNGMPKVMSVLSTVGIAAMLWVGGHILLTNAAELGWHAPYDLVHHLEEPVSEIATVGSFLAWCVNTLCSALVGIIVGAILVALMHVLPFGKGHDAKTAAH
ncbi:DUF808 domain-containing protein [Luteococcus sanguinis]|uniref:DUF808 domain-containing protein n=1 Tax=Luteococcus sanguinis TaxID=174038 RepID=A0ABW1X007_9ACTN